MRGREYYDRQVETLFAQRRCGVHDRPGITSRAQPDVAGHHDLRGIPADVAAVRVKHVALARELLRRAADKVPVLREPRGSAQRAALTAAADTDRRVRPLHRLGLTPRIGELVILAGEIRRLLCQQPGNDLAGLFKPVTALTRAAQLHAVRAGFLLIPAGADTQLERPPEMTSRVAAMLARTAG